MPCLKMCLPFLLPACSWRSDPSSCDGESGDAPVGSAAEERDLERWIDSIIPESMFRPGVPGPTQEIALD